MTGAGALPDTFVASCRIFAWTFFGKQKAEGGFLKKFYSSPSWSKRFLNCSIGEVARIRICSIFSALKGITNIPQLRLSRRRSVSERRCYPEDQAIRGMHKDGPIPLISGQGKRADHSRRSQLQI